MINSTFYAFSVFAKGTEPKNEALILYMDYMEKGEYDIDRIEVSPQGINGKPMVGFWVAKEADTLRYEIDIEEIVEFCKGMGYSTIMMETVSTCGATLATIETEREIDDWEQVDPDALNP